MNPDLILSTLTSLSPKLLLLFGAGCAGLTVALLAGRINFTLALTPQAGRAVLRYQGAGEHSAVEQLGERALRRLPLLGPLLQLQENRRWLSLLGAPPSSAYVIGLALLLGGMGLLIPIMSLKPFFLICALLGFLYPFLRIRSQAGKVRRRIERSLPELTAILAAEMAAGLPPDQALERAAAWTGPMSALLQQVLEASRRTGRPIFGRGPTAGALVATVEAFDLPSLRSFAVQLDAAARKGAAGPALMNALVQTYIVAYQDRSLQQAEKLETRLAVPSVLFFFMPLLFLILVPMMLPILKVL